MPVYANTTYMKPCHKGTIEVFEDPKSKIKIKAGGDWEGLEILPNHLIIDCGANVSKNVEVYGFKPHIDLEAKYNNTSITINWPDFGIPDLDFDFWEDLISVLRKTKKDVIVCCKGGHGRTGTCLSILAYFMLGDVDMNPVKFVRKNYCVKAVESANQIMYIEYICNIDLKGTKESNFYDKKPKGKEDKKADTIDDLIYGPQKSKKADPFYSDYNDGWWLKDWD